MPKVTARCTQCGTKAFGGKDNEKTYQVNREDLKHGDGREHGTEKLPCPTCSDTCGDDECSEKSPCDRCGVYTIHNRCGSSVPTAQQ